MRLRCNLIKDEYTIGVVYGFGFSKLDIYPKWCKINSRYFKENGQISLNVYFLKYRFNITLIVGYACKSYDRGIKI